MMILDSGLLFWATLYKQSIHITLLPTACNCVFVLDTQVQM